jgi:hypothetical protein
MKNIFLLVLLFPFISFSQYQINGKVIDSKSKKPLIFANIIVNKSTRTLTDIDGFFQIKSTKPISKITISYVGYSPKIISINSSKKYITVALNTSVENLKEVLITAKENPALRIIRNTIKNKNKNDIETALNSFRFKAYNKILVTANPDSLTNKIDSIFKIKKGKKTFLKLDSSNFNFRKEIKNKHLYISEKISEFQFQKGKNKKEIILASRMAGLQQPIFELLAVTLQGFSIYQPLYTIAGTKYLNPISNKALKQYTYKILDTVSNTIGKSVLVYFKPKQLKTTTGIEGVLYIDLKSFAITKAIFEIKGIVHIKATQNFSYNPINKIWFPNYQEILLKKGINKKQISLFGGVVKFSEVEKNDSIQNTKINSPDAISFFISKTKNFDLEINKPVTIKKSSATILFKKDAADKSEKFWNLYRTDSITNRDKITYLVLDSLAKKENIEHKINLARSILKGFYPTKYINLNLGKIINLNNYEGLRLGFGGITNTIFSSKFKLESYIAYGTKDTDFKYSFGGSIRLNEGTNTWFSSNFTNDIKEAASLDFIAENTSFSPVNPRNLNISKFYNYKTISLSLKHDFQPNFETKLQISAGDYTPVFNYQFISRNKNLTKYQLTLATIGFQYNPNSEYMNSPIGKLTIKNKYPQFTFQITKSFENALQSDFNFTQINLRILQNIKPLNAGVTKILIESGIVFGDAPISHLFNSAPNYTFKNPWRRRINLAGTNSFETMGYNEFISDRYTAIHIKHLLKPIKLSKKFKPQFTIVTRAVIGNISNPSYQAGIQFKSLKKGYFESGLELNSLFKGFGLSAHYRYGAYTYPIWSDNLAVKLTFKLNLGI